MQDAARSIPSPSTAQQAAWAERIREGDALALAEVHHAYHVPLWRSAYRYLASRDEAEDVVQSVFLELWERREQMVFRHGMTVYLFRAVRHRALDVLRHERMVERVRQRAPADVAGLSERALAPDDAVHLLLLQERLDHILADMPEQRRTILTLRWVDGMKYDEIASILDMSLSAVKMQVRRALQTVAAMLNVDGA
jgi:RNA polymerase sigma-70 factor (ECF subfamily)